MTKHNIWKPNNSLEQPSSDTFSQMIGKPINSLEQPSSAAFIRDRLGNTIRAEIPQKTPIIF